ncbi:MAG TPA: hypothetical protein EYF95_08295 [Flavobacteriales bacterium]|jgi:hypothetical protein|nr:hypothetical protein [Flavobacteriales bacterium]
MEFSTTIWMGVIAIMLFGGAMVYALKLKMEEEKRHQKLEERVLTLEKFASKKRRNRKYSTVKNKAVPDEKYPQKERQM